ncbi:MAG: N-acetylmuramoyl-L-alanine amidase [Elusimicrobiota bacterium]
MSRGGGAAGLPPRILPKVVVIDAGHGGKDDGAVVYGRVEKGIVLRISQRVADHLAGKAGISPFLTRWSDEFVSLTDRVLRAEAVGAQAFVSIHVDNVRGRKGRGVIAYVYGRNPRIPKGPPREPGERILPPPPRSQISRSRRLAEHLGRALRKAGIKNVRYVDRGPFAVLKSPRIPSVLIEIGNLRDRDEAAIVADPDFQDRVARAISRSLASFVSAEQNRFARNPNSGAK